MQVKNRLTFLKANLVKESNIAIEALSDTVTVIEPHRDRERDPVEQFLRELARDMVGGIAALCHKAFSNQGMYWLGESLSARRPDDVGRGGAKQRLQGVFGNHAPKDIAAADE